MVWTLECNVLCTCLMKFVFFLYLKVYILFGEVFGGLNSNTSWQDSIVVSKNRSKYLKSSSSFAARMNDR